MRSLILSALLIGALATVAVAQPTRTPILFDTDIGNDMDDALALALLIASDEADLRGVTIVGSQPDYRALLTCRFLTMTGRRHRAVATGSAPPVERKMAGQYQYYYHPDALFNRTRRPEKESAVEFLFARLNAQPGKVTILATGPLTNIAKLIEDKPKSKSLIRRIVWTGGNARSDVKSAKAVLASGVPLVVIRSESTAKLKLREADLKRIFAPGTALSLQIQALHQLGDEEEPGLADAFAAAFCLDERFATLEDHLVEIDENHIVRTRKGKANAKVVMGVKSQEFVKWFVGRMASYVSPSSKPVKPIARGGMPNRVHVAEDFETDIERRWWMAGKAETKILPPGSKRACRGVLTHDFDDLLGHSRAMYTAVIFNPVPGPPMGKNTRLNFQCYLDGTSTLRVQIYSLTNGYHRHLVLKDLPQKKWQNLTVDMTQARRPDGTGGPLAEGERIDDIQFYVDHKAGIIIDDIFLYDAAGKEEKRPFPKAVHFTGWFDSGKQGKEWPGTFDIAQNRGVYWHAAKSVEEKGTQVIRLNLRGVRPLGDRTTLSFRYHLTDGDDLTVECRDVKGEKSVALRGEKPTRGKWAALTLAVPAKALGQRIDEIVFRTGKGAELLVDDVLLYETGE